MSTWEKTHLHHRLELTEIGILHRDGPWRIMADKTVKPSAAGKRLTSLGSRKLYSTVFAPGYWI